MNINRLEEFIVLATQLNYSKAANSLYLTQPALSRHIHDLEETLGTKLFVRDTHKVSLTPIGEIFVEEARDIVEKYHHALRVVQGSIASTTGCVRLGFLSGALQPYLSGFYSQFKETSPNIKIELITDDLDPLIMMLNQNELDCAFISHINQNHYSGLKSKTLLVDRMGIVISPFNPLADRKSIKFKDLSGIPLIVFSKKSSPVTHDFQKNIFKQRNLNYNVMHEITSLDTGILLAEMNEGVFILPDHLQFRIGNNIFVPIDDEGTEVELNLVWKKDNNNPSLPAFRSAFTEFFQNKE